MIKKLLAHVGQYKKASILTPVMMIGEVLMETLIPFIMAALIDEGINAKNAEGVIVGDVGVVIRYGVLMLVCAFISLYFGTMGGKYGAKASSGFAANLRSAMYDNIQTFSFSNIDKFSTAGLVTRLTTDVTNCQNAYQMILRIAVRAPLTFICSMVKRDGSRQTFDKSKLINSMLKACEKRSVALSDLERIASEIEQELQNELEREIPTSEIGEMVMERLKDLDEVAYVRFASVYRQFKDINTFMEELTRLLEDKA